MDAITRQLNQAQRALDAGSVERAIAIAREAVRKHPRAAAALEFLGRSYCRVGKPAAGLPYLRRAASASPDDPLIRQTLAYVLAEMGLLDEAIATARDAIELERRRDGLSFDGQMLLGCYCGRAGLLAEAEACFSAAIELLPAELSTQENASELERLAAEAYTNLANVRFELGRPDEAVACYRRSIGYAPQYANAWTNLAAVLFALDRIADAVDAARRAVVLAPQKTAAWLTLGNALSEMGRWDDARQAFDALLSLEPLSFAARYNRSLARLALGEWSAWEDYRLRHRVEPTVNFETGLPSWAGEALDAKSILVRREQGIGTQLMFSGYLPTLANCAGSVIVECDSRLEPLLERNMPGIEFAPRRQLLSSGEDATAGERGGEIAWHVARPDVEVAIGDLPLLLRPANQVGDWAAGVMRPRLTPDAALFRKWRERLSRLGRGLCVGISWRGGGTTTARRKRSTTLDQWMPVLGVGGARFVSLQYGVGEEELAEHRRRGGTALHRWDDFDAGDDLDDLAALMAALDLVVSVDNSTVHLAGAVGAPTWVLLPAAADWRWQVEAATTPWYPTATLIRQQDAAAGWPPLFADVAGRLERLIAESGGAVSRVG